MKEGKTSLITPRRSLLYVPADNLRAVEKAKIIPADVIIFDLEDAVSPEAKSAARENIVQKLTSEDYGYRELVVRINNPQSDTGKSDISAIKELEKISAILIPKCESTREIEATHRLSDKNIWAMVETAKAITIIENIAACEQCSALVIGSNDLLYSIRGKATPRREALTYALSRSITAARAYNIPIFDGIFPEIGNLVALREEAIQGLMLGFDGKTLIHPEQVPIVNEIFSPSAEEIIKARKIIKAYEQAQKNNNRAVITVNNHMIEELHVEQAKKLLKQNEIISMRESEHK